MSDWKQIGLGVAALWGLFWIGWTVDIYFTDNIFIFPFVEMAIVVPALVGLILAFIAKTLGRIKPAGTRHLKCGDKD